MGHRVTVVLQGFEPCRCSRSDHSPGSIKPRRSPKLSTILLVPPRGIEPHPTDFQSAVRTSYTKEGWQARRGSNSLTLVQSQVSIPLDIRPIVGRGCQNRTDVYSFRGCHSTIALIPNRKFHLSSLSPTRRKVLLNIFILDLHGSFFKI